MNEKNLVFDRQTASRLSALIIIIGFFLFVAGYFLGKKHAVAELVNTIEQNSFTDQVYASMCSIYDVQEKNDDVHEPEK